MYKQTGNISQVLPNDDAMKEFVAGIADNPNGVNVAVQVFPDGNLTVSITGVDDAVGVGKVVDAMEAIGDSITTIVNSFSPIEQIKSAIILEMKGT